MKNFFDTGFRYNNSLSFNGATDKSTYFVSFSQISMMVLFLQMQTHIISILSLEEVVINW